VDKTRFGGVSERQDTKRRGDVMRGAGGEGE